VLVVVAVLTGLALGVPLAAGADRMLVRRDVVPVHREGLVVGLLAAAVLGTLAAQFDGWELAAYSVVGRGLVVLSWIDVRAQWLPREVTALTAAVAAPLLVVAALVAHEPHRLLGALAGALLALVILLAIHLVSRGGLGDGDVRLAPLLGMALGWLNPALVPVGLLFGCFAGAVTGLVLMAIGRAGRRTQVPFGPFLALGTLAALVAGEPFLDVVLQRS
jgi:leader peptidase (prepilin peptidase)/N-methyltransferase